MPPFPESALATPADRPTSLSWVDEWFESASGKRYERTLRVVAHETLTPESVAEAVVETLRMRGRGRGRGRGSPRVHMVDILPQDLRQPNTPLHIPGGTEVLVVAFPVHPTPPALVTRLERACFRKQRRLVTVFRQCDGAAFAPSIGPCTQVVLRYPWWDPRIDIRHPTLDRGTSHGIVLFYESRQRSQALLDTGVTTEAGIVDLIRAYEGPPQPFKLVCDAQRSRRDPANGGETWSFAHSRPRESPNGPFVDMAPAFYQRDREVRPSPPPRQQTTVFARETVELDDVGPQHRRRKGRGQRNRNRHRRHHR